MENVQKHIGTTIRTLDHAISRMNISLMALNLIQNEDSLNYYKDLHADDFSHNMETLFGEIRTINTMLHEEIEELRDYKLDLDAELKRLCTK